MNVVINETKSEIRKSDKVIAVFVMSHGHLGRIQTSDGKRFYLENLYGKFDNLQCPQLENKPKLFFIVSCLGKNLNKG